MLLSNQINEDVADAYQRAKWLLLRGVNSADPTVFTYAFFCEVLRYDLAAFFQRNSPALKSKIQEVLQILLSPER